MVFDIESMTKKLNDIEIEKDKLNEELKQTITNICDKDITQQTKEIKYSMYDGKEREYQIQNDKYKELISGFSDAYLSMSDFYVGPELPKDYIISNETYLDNIPELYAIFIFFALFQENLEQINKSMHEYDVD
jgi:hypothetical protein